MTGRTVRCLGPGKEHSFFSDDPQRRRLCPNCTVKRDQMSRVMSVHHIELPVKQAHHSKAT